MMCRLDLVNLLRLVLLFVVAFLGSPAAISRPKNPVPPAPQVYPPPALVRKVMPSVAKILTSSGQCSAALVAPRLLVTAWHCVAMNRPISVFWQDGSSSPGDAYLVDGNPQTDLALIALPQAESKRPLLPIMAQGKLPKFGEQVFTIGHPWRSDFKVTDGRVLLIERDFISTDVRVRPGNSGGPLIDQAGRLIGIVSAYIKLYGTREIGDSPTHTQLHAMLQRVGSNPQRLPIYAAQGNLGLGLAWRSDDLLEQLADQRMSIFSYKIFYDVADRIRLGFRHATWRPEDIKSLELGYKFPLWREGNSTVIFAIPYVGQAQYKTPQQNARVDKYGVTLEVLGFLDLEYEVMRYAGKNYSSISIGI